jgi:hypothetical protein
MTLVIHPCDDRPPKQNIKASRFAGQATAEAAHEKHKEPTTSCHGMAK